MKHNILQTGLSLTLGLSFVIVTLNVIAGFTLTPLPVHAAGNRYVTPTGLDTGNTCLDQTNPCATIQHAINVAEPDDVIKIAAGVYTDVNN